MSRRGSSRKTAKARRVRQAGGAAAAKPDAPDPVAATPDQPEPAETAPTEAPEQAGAAGPAKAMQVVEIKPPTPARVEAAQSEAGGEAHEPEKFEVTGEGSSPEPEAAWSRAASAVGPRVQRGIRWAKRSRVKIAWGLLLAACGVVGLALFAMTLADSEPTWWDSGSMRTAEMTDLARRVENGAITHITADHQGATTAAVEWPVKLSDDQANAWLNLRLPVWLPRMTAEDFEDVVDPRGVVVERQPIGGVRWPESVEEVRVAFIDGRFRIGARVRTGEGTQVFGATLAPEVRDDGSLWMRATSVSVGRVGLPAGLVLGSDGGRLRDSLPSSLVDSAEGEAIFSKLAGEAPLFEDAVIRLGDGRRVRLLSLEVASDSLVAWFRTE